jgi:PAS domain S-box-containing protein
MSSTGSLPELDALRSQVADLSRQLAERDHSSQHQREQSDLLRAIVEGTAAETGEAFFSALVTHLTSVLHIKYAFIGEVQGDHIRKIRTLAVSAGGAIVDNFEYALADTPCAAALTQSFACFDRDLQATFPQFQRVTDLGAESYCAVPLRTKGEAIIGLLVVMDTKPWQQGDDLRLLLEVFVPRIAAEFERRRAEQERAQALADLHNVIETIPDIVFALDTQGNVVKWNRRLGDVTGYSPAELWNKPALAFVPPEEQARTAAAIQQVFVEGYAELEGHLLTKERRLIPYHWTGALLKNTHGEPIGITGIGRDVSDKKRGEEALRKSEERYARATAVGKVGVWELDVAAGTYYGDPNLKGLFGYVGDELSTDPYVWLNLVHPDDRSIAMDHWQRIVNGETDNYHYELRMLKKDGMVIWTDVRGHAIRDHEGQVIQLLGTTVDVTEREQAQDALVQSERQIHTVLDALPVGVWFTDRSGKPLLVNPMAKQIWSNIIQIEPQTPSNQSGWWDIFGPVSGVHRRALSHTLRTGVPSQNEILDFECLDGTKKVIRNSTVPVRDEAGVVLGAIVLNEDITALRQVQEALKLTQFSVDHAVEGFFWFGPDARILNVNEAACQLLEYTRDELTAMTVYDIDPNSFPELWLTQWDELKEKRSLTFETKYWSRTGRVLDMEVTVNYLQYEGTEYNCAIMRDIGERKRAQAALCLSEERYRSLYDETPTMYFTLATDGTVRSVNRFGAEQLGYQVEELIGHSVLGFFHEEDMETVVASLSECLATPEISRHWELRKIRKDGTVIWVQETARVSQSSTGETVVLVTCEDITERNRAEQAFRRSEERFRTMFTQAPIGMALIDSLTGQIYEANSKFAHISGRTKEEVSSLNWMSITHPDDVQTDLDNMARLNAREIAGFQMEKRYIWPDGKVVWINLTVAPIQVEEYAGPRHLAMIEDITERKQAEQEQARLIEDLTRSQQHFQALFNWTPSAVGISTVEEGRFIDVNEGFSRLTGYMREEVMGRTTLELGLWADVSERESVLREIQEQGYLHNQEGLLRTKSGEIRSLMVSVESIQLGSTPCLIYLCHDITERKRVEERLRRTQFSMDQAVDAIYWVDAQAKILFANEAASLMVGYSRDELLGMTVQDLNPDFTASRWPGFWEEVRQNRSMSFETVHRAKDGRLVPIDIRVSFLAHEGHEFHCAFVRDITERKQVEEALRKKDLELDHYFTNALDLLCIADVTGRFKRLNKAWEVTLGYSLEELEGAKFLDYVHPDDMEATLHALGDLAEQKEVSTFVNRYRRKDGSYRWIEWKSIPDGDLIYAGARDITERKRMEDALRTRERELQTALQERERISQDLHDGILQSLFAVGLTLEVAKSLMPPKTLKASGASLNKAIDQLNRVMREIRNFIAGLDSELLEGKDLPAALKHLLESLTENQPTRVRFAVEDRAAKALSAEQSLHLLRIIQEAVSNCIRHGHAQEASVSLKLLKQGVRLRIRDDGRGFSQDTVKTGGYGLRNMAARAQRLGGRFTVLSRVKEGTNIVLDLPKEVSDVSL